jgi:hypothetical protein
VSAQRAPARALLILSCSSRKLWPELPGALFPALELYDGPAYRTLRKALRESQPERHPVVLILSAEHGLIRAEEEIALYDRRMDAARAREIADDARSLERLAQVLACARRRAPDPEVEHARVFVFGGVHYRAVVQAWEHAGHFGPLRLRYCEGGIGVQLGQLKRWLATVCGGPRPGTHGR